MFGFENDAKSSRSTEIDYQDKFDNRNIELATIILMITRVDINKINKIKRSFHEGNLDKLQKIFEKNVKYTLFEDFRKLYVSALRCPFFGAVTRFSSESKNSSSVSSYPIIALNTSKSRDNYSSQPRRKEIKE